jgi:hypothetical protein
VLASVQHTVGVLARDLQGVGLSHGRLCWGYRFSKRLIMRPGLQARA